MTIRLALTMMALLAAVASVTHAGTVANDASPAALPPVGTSADPVDCRKTFGKYDRPLACEDQTTPDAVKAESVLPTVIDRLSGKSDSGVDDLKDPDSPSDIVK